MEIRTEVWVVAAVVVILVLLMIGSAWPNDD
jgi:hypothetical protein